MAAFIPNELSRHLILDPVLDGVDRRKFKQVPGAYAAAALTHIAKFSGFDLKGDDDESQEPRSATPEGDEEAGQATT